MIHGRHKTKLGHPLLELDTGGQIRTAPKFRFAFIAPCGCTPAMAARVTDRLWGDVLKIVEI